MGRALWVAALALGIPFAMNACKMQDDAQADPTSHAATSSLSTTTAPVATAPTRPLPSNVPRGVRFVEAPPGDVPTLVRAEMAKAQADHRTLLVYAGATWCEPCQRFHKAAAAGELDDALSGITFLTFDVDQDRERLLTAGYHSTYIPLFVVPGPDGRSSGRQIEGSIKGDGAPREIAPRLLQLIGR